jgi:hypothetical protein
MKSKPSVMPRRHAPNVAHGTSLQQRAVALRQAARDVQEESREIIARCLEGRIRRENDRRSR